MGIPKPLIPVGGKPLINYWLHMIEDCGEEVIDETFVVTNQLHFWRFKEWAEVNNFPVANLINDGTECNSTRLGACADIELVVRERELDSHHLLIIAGDTLFLKEFSLPTIVEKFYRFGARNMITYYHLLDHNEVSKRGIVELDGNNRVRNFLEKPAPEETESNKASPALYFYCPEAVKLLRSFVHNTPLLEDRDAPGMFLRWLYKTQPVFATEISGRFDIGNLRDYIKADEYFTQNQST